MTLVGVWKMPVFVLKMGHAGLSKYFGKQWKGGQGDPGIQHMSEL